MQVVIRDVKCGTVEGEVCVAIVADVYFLFGRITPIVPGKPFAIENIGSHAAFHGHTAMADTPAEVLDASINAGLIVNGEAVFVAPKPDDRAVNNLGELPRGDLIPILEARMWTMMRQQDQSAFIVVRVHFILQPGEQWLREATSRLERGCLTKPLAAVEYRQLSPVKTRGIVAGIERDD